MERMITTDAETGGRTGWFDYDAAEKFNEETRWDDHNFISVNTGSQWEHEQMLRTAGGRWVLRRYSSRQGAPDACEFVSDDRAREWLTVNEHDAALERLFGEVETERAPGRPEIGEPINVRLGALLADVDAYASESGITRAEAIRVLLGEAITAARPYAVTRLDISTRLREEVSRHSTLGAAVEALRHEQADDLDAQGLPSSQPRVEHDGQPVDTEAYAD